MLNWRPPIWQPNRRSKQAATCCNQQPLVVPGDRLFETGGRPFDRLLGCQNSSHQLETGGHLLETSSHLLETGAACFAFGQQRDVRVFYKISHKQAAACCNQVAACLVKNWQISHGRLQLWDRIYFTWIDLLLGFVNSWETRHCNTWPTICGITRINI